MHIQPLAEERRTKAVMNDLLIWIHEAGNPYFDWLFGGAEVALPIIASRMTCPGSELFVGDADVLLDDSGDAIGCFIALTGATLAQRRRRDAIAYLNSVGSAGRNALTSRIKESRNLFASIGSDEFYLSKLAVRREMRKRGRGRALVERFLAAGVDRGLHRFALDVSESNISAVQLYESMGFHVSARSNMPAAGITYLAMRMAM